jgi:large subunit ribosomal protein L20
MAVNMPIAIAVSKSAPSGLTYSRFMEGLKAAKCALDRKVLADIAAQDAAAFTELVNLAKNALKNKPGATLAKA